MTTTANKRGLEEANIDSSNPSKKRKLNEDESISTSSNNNNNNDDDKKNDNTAKSKSNDEKNEKNEKNDKKDPNSDVSNWTFKASDFTFGNNSWVKQTSNASDLSNDESTTNDNDKVSSQAIIDKNTTDSFAKFEGLGFKKVLDDENSKSKQAANGKSDNDDNTDNDKDKTKDKDTKKDDDGGWGGSWSNSNPDGTFKLSFDWGSWENSNTKIDLNPSSKIGWESQAPKFDPNTFEQDDKTKEVMKQMVGEQDSGDKNDEEKCSIHCKIYNLESGKYIERGKGIVKVNTYKVKVDDEETIKGRILCRRDQILNTIINAQILKEMKFEKVGNFVRFAVVQQKEKKVDDDDKDDDENNKNKNKTEQGEDKKEDKNEDKTEEDNDMETEIKTFLMKPINKSKIDTLLSSIQSVQQLL